MKVKNLFTINPSGSTKQFEGFINYIDTSSVIDGKLITVQYLNDNYPSRAKRVIKKDDILYSTVRPNLRHYYHHVINIDHSVASTGFAVLRNIDDRKADTKFVFYYLTLPYIVNYLDSIAQASQTTYPTFSPKDLGRINLPNIDIITQNKIASILSKYDDLIENNNRRIKILEQMAENLYKEWFVRFRFPGHENTRFDNELPCGWEFKRLGEFGISLDSGSRPSGGIDSSLTTGVPSLGAEAVKGLAEFDYSSVKYIPHEHYNKMKRGKFDGNAILIYKDGAYIGKTTTFRNDFPFRIFAVNEHVFLMKSNNFSYQNYLYFTLHQKEYFYLMQNLNRNSAQPGLAQSDITRIKVTVPSENIVKQFNAIIEPIFVEVFQLAKVNKNLAQQRDMLLPRLMSGKLKVKV